MRSRRPRDLNRLAASIVADVVDERSTEEKAHQEGKNPAAVALGRLGGIKGGKARAIALSPEKRSRIAALAAKARWSRGREE